MKKQCLISMLLILFLFVSLSVRPCLSAEPEAIKIGALISFTGFISGAEVIIYQGIEIAKEWINERGGITIDKKPYKIELIAEDIKSSAEGTVAAANKLLYDDKVKFVIGGTPPFIIMAAGSVLEPAKVLRVVFFNCDTPQEFGPHTPYMFIPLDTEVEGMKPALEYLKRNYPNVKTISATALDDGGVKYVADLFTSLAEPMGYKVIDVVPISFTTQDYTATVAKIMSLNPGAIAWLNGFPQQIAPFLKIARQRGYEGPVFVVNYAEPEQMLTLAGKDASNKFFSHNLVLDDPGMTPTIKEIAKRARHKYGEANAWHVWGFDALWTLVQAIEKAQSLDPTVVKNSWEKMDKIDTPYGPGKMCGEKTHGIKHKVCHPIPNFALEDGKIVWKGWLDVNTP